MQGDASDHWLLPRDGGWTLVVLARPGASRSGVTGVHDGQLALRLAAPPVDGRANAELVAFVAKRLKLPKSAVRLVRGESSRRKTLHVDGDLPREQLSAALSADRPAGPAPSAEAERVPSPRCPACGAPNGCTAGAPTCWCFAVEPRQPLPVEPRAACYCRGCLAARPRSDAAT